MPKDLLIQLKTSKLWLLCCGLIHVFFLAMVLLYLQVGSFFSTVIVLGCCISLFWVCYRVMTEPLAAIGFTQRHDATAQQHTYLGYLLCCNKPEEKQWLHLLHVWQFFPRVFLLQYRLHHNRKLQPKVRWCLLLPDSFLYRDQSRQLVWILRFGNLGKSGSCKGLSKKLLQSH